MKSAILGAALVLAPSLAFAAGNTLSLTNATFDTFAPKFGAGALNGGFGLTLPGACYADPSIEGPFPEGGQSEPLAGVGKSVWFKMSTTAPSSPQLIFGDQELYVGEDVTGLLVVGSGSTFVNGPYALNAQNVYVQNPAGVDNGTWHHVTAYLFGAPGTPGTTITAFLDGVALPVPNAGPKFIAGAPFSSANIGNLASVVTGIGGGVLRNSSGTPAASFSGEIDEAACLVEQPPLGIPGPSEASGFVDVAYTTAFAGTETGIVGLWHLDGNGIDSSTWRYSAPPMPAPYVPPSFPSYVTTPANGFPFQ